MAGPLSSCILPCCAFLILAGEPCPQPDSWCTGEGEHIEKLDCGDGDGIDDWVCINNATGQRAVLLSSSDCTLDYWPQADKSLCPNRFSGELDVGMERRQVLLRRDILL